MLKEKDADGDLAFNDSEWTNDRTCENKHEVKDSKFKAKDLRKD